MELRHAPHRSHCTPYNKLLVEDFTDEATAKLKPEARPLLEPKIAAGTKMFPDQIASVVKAGGGFDEVMRSGTANFDSKLQLVDGGTGAVLGTWVVDKNSWALGGVFAVSQKPEDFMQEAAKKIGTELSDKRKAGAIKKPGN